MLLVLIESNPAGGSPLFAKTSLPPIRGEVSVTGPARWAANGPAQRRARPMRIRTMDDMRNGECRIGVPWMPAMSLFEDAIKARR